MEERDLAVTLARGRIAFGVVSVLAPGFLARTMTGRSDGGTRLFVRMVGARDLGVGLGLHVALDRDASTPPHSCSRALISARASSRAPSAWRLPERCSVPGWRGKRHVDRA